MSALLTLGVFGPGELLLVRLAGGVGAGAAGVAALERLLDTLPREVGAAAAGGAAAAVSAGAAIAFWGGPRLIPETGWKGALALPGGALLVVSLAVLVLARRTEPVASPMAEAGLLPLRRLLPPVSAALLANGAFGAGLVLLPVVLEEQGTPPHLAGSLAAAAALAPVLAGPLAGVLGVVAARRRRLYSASALLVASLAVGFALRPGGGGWAAAGLLAVAFGGAGTGLAALFPMAAATVSPEGARGTRVALATLCHLGTGAALLGAAWGGIGPRLWAGLGAAAAAGGLVTFCVRE